MYSSYSPLQRRQLREQTYTDTQSTYLLVYAPGRRNANCLSAKTDGTVNGGA